LHFSLFSSYVYTVVSLVLLLGLVTCCFVASGVHSTQNVTFILNQSNEWSNEYHRY